MEVGHATKHEAVGHYPVGINHHLEYRLVRSRRIPDGTLIALTSVLWGDRIPEKSWLLGAIHGQ